MSQTAQRRVLVVDDDRSIREYLRFVLEPAGYEVEEAENGAVAVEKFRRSAFDLVITDISMPEKDGIDAIIEMRGADTHAKFIAMSGVAKSDTLLEIARIYKADRVIKKPFQSEDILTAVSRVFEQ
jgi:CheY-like chemotaxis protein